MRSRAVRAVACRYFAIFAVVFGAQVLVGARHPGSVSTLVAGVTAAAAAGLVTLARTIEMIRALEAELAAVGRVGVSLKVKTAAYQLVTGFAAMFVGSLLADLATGASHLPGTSFPDLVAVIVAAISGAIYVVVEWAIDKIPAPHA